MSEDNFVLGFIWLKQSFFFFFFTHALSSLLSDFQERERSQPVLCAREVSWNTTRQEKCRITKILYISPTVVLEIPRGRSHICSQQGPLPNHTFPFLLSIPLKLPGRNEFASDKSGAPASSPSVQVTVSPCSDWVQMHPLYLPTHLLPQEGLVLTIS